MDERGRQRYDRSRYGSQGRSQDGQRPDSFYRHLRVPGEDPSLERMSGEAATDEKPGSRSRIARNVAIAVTAVILIGAAAVFAYANVIAGNLHEGVDQDLRDALVPTDMAREPFYMVLLGTDGSAQRDEEGELGGVYRSDSMMLARIDPVNKKVTLVSIGRDIMVDLGQYGEEKINAAYALGGAALAVKAVSDLAGVPISHYAQVDFDGFAAMVDALGGVEVDVPIRIDDWDAGGTLEAGTQTLYGHEALILCRSRNAYADISAHPDEMRTANQRLVLSAIAKKLLASDVATIAATVSAMSEYVTTDLSLNDIIGLAQIMRGLNSDADIYTASVPTTSEYIDEGWYEFVDEPAWKAMMKRVAAGMAPTEGAVVDETTGTVMASAGSQAASNAEKHALVTVKNGTGIDGLAARVRDKLRLAGFVNVDIGTAAEGYEYPETLVIYDEEVRAREATEIAGAVGQGRAVLNDGSYLLLDADFMVVIGEDWRE